MAADRAHVLGRQLPMLPQHQAQLFKYAARFGSSVRGSLDLNRVAARDAATLQGLPDHSQELIAMTKKQGCLITIGQVDTDRIL